MRCLVIILLAPFISLWAGAQQILTAEEFMTSVRQNHPIAKQAALEVKIAEANVTSARGGFDPVWQTELAEKTFDGLLYYNNQQHQLKVPTWLGIDIEGGIQTLSGSRTSTPETLGETSYVGFSVPVAKNLLMDRRRATLLQAKIYRQQSVEVQRQMVNQVLFEAQQAYWNWWEQYQLKLLFEAAARNASSRFKFVTTAYEIGERPAIDTTEALTQLQSFQLRQQEIEANLLNAALEVQLYLWNTGGQPAEFTSALAPQAAMPATAMLPLAELLQQVNTHPQLAQYPFKLRSLEVEKRLKFQSLLPQINLKYNQLGKSHDIRKGIAQPWFANNYRYGLQVAIPLRLSEGRGEYREAKLKIQQVEWEQLAKQVALQTKLKQYYNEWLMLLRQISLQQQVIASYQQLQRGEELRFSNGESSLFLVNNREQKTLEAQQKLIELQQKAQKTRAAVYWSAGIL